MHGSIHPSKHVNERFLQTSWVDILIMFVVLLMHSLILLVFVSALKEELTLRKTGNRKRNVLFSFSFCILCNFFEF